MFSPENILHVLAFPGSVKKFIVIDKTVRVFFNQRFSEPYYPGREPLADILLLLLIESRNGGPVPSVPDLSPAG